MSERAAAGHRLADVAFARAGDKGDTADIALFAPDREVYELLEREVTAERVRAHFGAWVTGEVERYEVPNVLALNFVLHGALGGGGPRSLRADNLGKALGGALLRLGIDLPDHLADRVGALRAPVDPYEGADWLAGR